MERIKVYLQRPWKFADSAYYKYLLNYPPREINYTGQVQRGGAIESKRRMNFLNSTKHYIRSVFRALNLPIPNAHLTPKKDYDMIHCAHCLSLNRSPWICDTEWVGQFWVSANFDKHPPRFFVRRILERENCKKILAWTKWAYDGIVNEFPEIKDKVEIVYPGIPAPDFKRVKSKKIRLLYVSRRFYFKGGLYALEVMDRLTKKYDNVEGLIVSEVPEEVLKKYSKNKKIKFSGMVPQKELVEKIYPATDILVYPSFTDTFGFAITEAMAFGIPVVSVGGHSRREIIEDGKTGFVVDEPKEIGEEGLRSLCWKGVIGELCEQTEKIILDKRMRESMRKKAIKEIRVGKFSIKKRNERLRKIYEESMR